MYTIDGFTKSNIDTFSKLIATDRFLCICINLFCMYMYIVYKCMYCVPFCVYSINNNNNNACFQ